MCTVFRTNLWGKLYTPLPLAKALGRRDWAGSLKSAKQFGSSRMVDASEFSLANSSVTFAVRNLGPSLSGSTVRDGPRAMDRHKRRRFEPVHLIRCGVRSMDMWCADNGGQKMPYRRPYSIIGCIRFRDGLGLVGSQCMTAQLALGWYRFHEASRHSQNLSSISTITEVVLPEVKSIASVSGNNFLLFSHAWLLTSL